MLIILVLIFSIGVLAVSAAKPPKTVLEVTITNPQDGLAIENGGLIDVAGNVVALKGDAGLVDTYVQYAVGEGSTDFRNLGGSDPSVLQIVSGNQPQTQTLHQDGSYDVDWTLTGPTGTYEIRIYSEGELAKSGSSESMTVRILGALPPPGVVVIHSEEQDPSTGYGAASGGYENTYNADGVYEILSEEMNAQGTRKPVDDTTELGWIFTFELPTPRTATTFYLYGYAEFPEDDSDTTFLVQEEVGSTWQTLLEVSHTSGNNLRHASVADLISPVVRLRIVDDDRTIGDKKISSLYIDLAYIGLDDYEPPISGIEILTTPYTCHGFQAWENYGTDWYHDATIPITSAAAIDIVIVDLDFDGKHELVVAEFYSETHGAGIIEIFDLEIGTAPVDTLVFPEEIGGSVTSIAVGNFDLDTDLEIAGITWFGAVIWDKVYGEYQIALILQEPGGGMDLVTAGNLDEDAELEVVFAVGWDPALCEIALFDYDPVLDTWVNTANYSDFVNHGSWFYHMEINDVDQNDSGELYVMFKDDPFYILSYTDGAFVDFWTIPDVIVGSEVGYSFVTGDITNDDIMDIVFYTPFLDMDTTGYRIFEYKAQGFVNTYNISMPGMANIFGNQMAIGDIDGDLMNELVVSGGPGGIYSEGKLYIFRYDSLIFMADLNANESNCVVIGDYDNDAFT